MPAPPVSLAYSEQHLLSSRLQDQDYVLYIALPPSYAHAPDATYPVVYMLDANVEFAIMAQSAHLLQLAQDIPEVLIVGIGYPTDEFETFFRLRAQDMTPTHAPAEEKSIEAMYGFPITSGGAATFLRILKEEIFPFIEQHFRANPSRLFAGHSYGGLFGAYVLFNALDTFHHYLLGSPSVEWDNKVIFEHEAAYAATHTDLPASLFLSVGSEEEDDMTGPIQHLTAVLSERAYPSLNLTTHIFPDETHASVIPATFSRGLRVLLGTPQAM